jgi:hypothetical protein
MKSWIFYYYHGASFTVGIPLAYGFRFRRTLSPDLKALMRYLWVTFIIDAVNTIVPYFMYNTVWVDNCYLPIEVAFTMWVFLEMQNSEKKKIGFMCAILAFSLLWLGEIIIVHKLFQYSEFSRPIEGLMFVVAAAVSIFGMQSDATQLLTERPAFWICAAFLLFYTPNVLLYFLTDILMAISPHVLLQTMLPTTALSLASYLLMTKAFQCHSQRLKLSGG